MRKIVVLVSTLLFIVACGGEDKEQLAIDKLIEQNNFEALKEEKVKLNEKINKNKALLLKINQALSEDVSSKKMPLVSVISIEETSFEHYVELQGSVETDENILVYPEFQGTLLDFKVSMGDKVKKGDVIAIIDDGGLRAQLAQMEEQTALSKITFERQKKLWDQKIGSELDFLRAETAYNSNLEAVKQMKKQLAKATVTAPFTGQIDETLANEGQLLVPGQTPLFRIISLKNMYIQAEVPEKYLSSIKEGRSVMINLPVLDTTIKTKVSKVANYINPNNRSYRIEIDIPNNGGSIKPNLTAKLKVNDYINPSAILIPQSIVSENSVGDQYVFIAKPSDKEYPTAQRVTVKLGKTQGDLIEVLSGLKAGDQVIKEGARTVKENQSIEILS